MLSNGSWLESKVSEGGTASARVREQLDRARAVVEGVTPWHAEARGPHGVARLRQAVKADRIYALVPIESGDRGDGRRTYVHVDGLDQPIVASRSERAILADVEAALTEAAGVPARRRRSGAKEQENLF